MSKDKDQTREESQNQKSNKAPGQSKDQFSKNEEKKGGKHASSQNSKPAGMIGKEKQAQK